MARTRISRRPATGGRAPPSGRPVRRRARAAPGQGAVVQQRPRRGGRVGAGRAACADRLRHRQAHQPVRGRRAVVARSRPGRRPRGRSGQRLRRRRRADAPGRPGDRGTAHLDLPRDRRRARVRRRCARGPRPTKPNLRVLLDEALASDDAPTAAADPTGSIRTAGGAVLVTTPDIDPRRPDDLDRAPRARPTDDEQLDLDLAWRLVRGVTSNAIVLVRDRRLVGMGSGQTSRVDAARQAVAKAHAMLGPTRRGRRLRLGRVLPVPRRGRGLPRGRRAGLRPARRLDARRRGGGRRRRRRRHDAHDGRPPFPPLTGLRIEYARGVSPS